MLTRPLPEQSADIGDELTAEEKAAIRALQRVAKRWPSTLMLRVMVGGAVDVIRPPTAVHADLAASEPLAHIAIHADAVT